LSLPSTEGQVTPGQAGEVQVVEMVVVVVATRG